MSFCWPAIISQEEKSGLVMLPEWIDSCFWVGIFWFSALWLKLPYFSNFFFFFFVFSWIVVYAHFHNSSLKIKNIIKKSELMQWDCVKTRPKEQVDRQLRWQVGGRIYFSDLGHSQKAGRHGTYLLVYCTLLKRKWKARRDVEHGFRCQVEDHRIMLSIR